MSTQEEEFNQEVWYVLKKVEKERLATLEGKSIEYHFPLRHFAGAGIVAQGRQKQILYKLQEFGALNIRENPWEPPESTPYLFYLDLTPDFYSTYKNYQKICDPEGYSDSQPEKHLSLLDVADKNMEHFRNDKIQLLNKLLQVCDKNTETVELWNPASLAQNDSDRGGLLTMSMTSSIRTSVIR